MRFPTDKGEVRRILAELDATYSSTCADTILGMLNRELDAVDDDAGTVVYRFLPQAWMRNPVGVIHGGLIATMFDNAMGMTACALAGGKLTPTVELQVSYLDPVTADRPVLVRVTLRRAGHTLSRLTAELWQEDADKPAAVATGTFVSGRG